MLSRVADSLYWMSRYFERADHTARVLEATYNLMLNPSNASLEQRWQRITTSLGLGPDAAAVDPQAAMIRLTLEPSHRSSLLACLSGARDNASQVRDEISSEMWERLNSIYHDLKGASQQEGANPMRVVSAVREGAYRFYGVTDATMNHGEGWYFIQLGKFIERACTIATLVDTHFSATTEADDLEWVGLLSSCLAFEAYCKVYTADMKPSCVAEFLLLNGQFPYSVRYSADRMYHALETIALTTSNRKVTRIDRLIGQLRSSLAYSQIQEIIGKGLHPFLNGVNDQCRALHAAVHDAYIDYPIESAFEA
jgi:uncharacterized alpha-E superfamily protein